MRNIRENLEFINQLRVTRRKGLLKLRKYQGDVSLSCLGINCKRNCCCSFNTIQIKKNEIKNYSNLIRIQGITYIPIDNNKCCHYFHPKKGECTIYHKRPQSCKEYPWYKLKNEIYFDAGCPGINNDSKGQIPNSHLITDSDRYFERLPHFFRKVLLWYLTKF